MRIAVCFSGQVRCALENLPSMRSFFGSWFDRIDFFIHTWDINIIHPIKISNKEHFHQLGYTNIDWTRMGQSRYMPVQNLDRVIEAYKPRSVLVENYRSVSEYWVRHWYERYQAQLGLDAERPLDYWQPLYYTFRRSIELKQAYEREHNFQYDMVLKMRMDSVFCQEDPSTLGYSRFSCPKASLDLEIEHFNKDRSAFYVNQHDLRRVDDIIWYSNSRVMDTISGFIEDNLSELLLNMNDYCRRKGNIEIKNMAAGQYAILRWWFRHWPTYDFPVMQFAEQLIMSPSESNWYDNWDNETRNRVKGYLLSYGINSLGLENSKHCHQERGIIRD